MKKLMVVAAAAAVFAAGCGGAGDDIAEDAVEPGDAGASVTTVVLLDDPGATPDPDSAPPTTITDQPIVDEEDLAPVKTTIPPNEPAPVEGEVSQPVSHPDPNAAIAMTDLVARIGVAAGDITVRSIEEVTWSDGSLGCPLPGMRYTQALVNGTRIVLEADGAIYEYHSGPGREPFYCQNPSDPVSGDYGDQ